MFFRNQNIGQGQVNTGKPRNCKVEKFAQENQGNPETAENVGKCKMSQENQRTLKT